MNPAPSIADWKANAAAALAEDLNADQQALTDAHAASAAAILGELLTLAGPVLQAVATASMPGPEGVAVGAIVASGAAIEGASLTAGATALTPEQTALAKQIAAAAIAAMPAKKG